MFVDPAGEVVGVGYRASGKGAGMGKFRTLPRPANCHTYKQYSVGKFCRYLLTEEGKLFFSG